MIILVNSRKKKNRVVQAFLFNSFSRAVVKNFTWTCYANGEVDRSFITFISMGKSSLKCLTNLDVFNECNIDIESGWLENQGRQLSSYGQPCFATFRARNRCYFYFLMKGSFFLWLGHSPFYFEHFPGKKSIFFLKLRIKISTLVNFFNISPIISGSAIPYFTDKESSTFPGNSDQKYLKNPKKKKIFSDLFKIFTRGRKVFLYTKACPINLQLLVQRSRK